MSLTRSCTVDAHRRNWHHYLALDHHRPNCHAAQRQGTNRNRAITCFNSFDGPRGWISKEVFMNAPISELRLLRLPFSAKTPIAGRLSSCIEILSPCLLTSVAVKFFLSIPFISPSNPPLSYGFLMASCSLFFRFCMDICSHKPHIPYGG